MVHAVNQVYDLAKWPEVAHLLPKATEVMSDKHKKLITGALDGENGSSFSSFLQIPVSDTRREYTLRELMDSVVNETSQQRIDPAAVERILFGTDGLIRRAGGGRALHLMEDIEVAYIVQPSAGVEIGPIITSGRNRLLAIQILIKAAAPKAALDDIKLRCTTIRVSKRDEIERRIVSANMGSRTMNRAEVRERRAGKHGLNVSSLENLKASLETANSTQVYPPAFGARLKLYAIQHELTGLTPDQYSSAGTTTYNALCKANKTLVKWIDEYTPRFWELTETACLHLEDATTRVKADKSRGAHAHKLARILTRRVADAHSLSVKV